MPVIKTSAADLKASVRIGAGWFRAKIRELKVEPTSDKSGLNYNFYFLVDDNGNERTIKHTVNKAVWPSFGPPIVCAALSTETAPYKVDKDAGNDWEIDTDEVAGKALWIKFEPEPYQGNILNKPKQFMPIHYDPNNSPF